ncbi:SNARE protein, putative [Plasmodium chabaudi chabaudi]|uniref:SNARE protein, putative n=1 Tax=Plasmodium chabaudi chabaudi TaxID=31271 RepID=A0A1C6YRV3_PLACU|nr:SNARE protein, putative [Plasmodium chabaudi chabaudi]
MEKKHRKHAYSKRDKITEIEKKCEESLNEILRSANEVSEISKKAELELEQQTEQIKHINKETDNIQERLKQSQYHLEGIKYWWKNINSFLGFQTTDENENIKIDSPINNHIEKKNNNHYKNNHGKTLNRTYADLLDGKNIAQRKGTFDDKYERDLNMLSSMLDELHTRALVMGNTINEQNKMLNNVNEKMENNIEKIQDQQKLMKEIMKR